MACAACYELETPWVKLYTQFKKDVSKEAIVFKKALLRLTVCILTRISGLIDEYMQKTFSVWKKTVTDVQAIAKEHAQLCKCLSMWYTCLDRDTAKFEELGKPVLDLLYIEDRRIKTDEHVLLVKSKIAEDSELFVPLLFVPRFGDIAAPFVHGGAAAERDFRAPPVARTQEENAAASTLAMTKTFVNGIKCFITTMDELTASLGEVCLILERLYKDAIEQEFDEASENAMELHYDMVKNFGPRVQLQCSDMAAVASIFYNDTQEVPYDRTKHADQWMEEAVAEDEEPIKDKVFDITTDFEVLGLTDGF